MRDKYHLSLHGIAAASVINIFLIRDVLLHPSASSAIMQNDYFYSLICGRSLLFNTQSAATATPQVKDQRFCAFVDMQLQYACLSTELLMGWRTVRQWRPRVLSINETSATI